MENVNFKRFSFLLFTILLTSSLSLPVLAEESKPKIGLVLAGGGARGLAHIGVIKALEKQNIKIDYITGTSMGALIGGLYAAGLSSSEIENFATNLDWEDSFNDEPKRAQLPFRQKQDEFNYFIKGEIGMKDWELKLPSGFVQGQKQDLMLEKMLVNTANINDFTKLPIPFTAIATDISSGKAYSLNKGNLAKALRASMSVPGIFSPVIIDGHLLVDGGMTNNTPIDIARKMGADIIIVSDLHQKRTAQNNLQNILDISSQIVNGLTLNNSLKQLKNIKQNDVIIRPNLLLYSSTDFTKAKEIILAGEKAASSEYTLNNLKNHPKTRTPTITKIPNKIIIKKIQINNQTNIDTNIINQAISQQINSEFDVKQLEKDLSSLYGYGYFQNINYDIVPFSTNQSKLINSPSSTDSLLVIHATPPSWGPNFFKINFELKSNLSDQNLFNLGVRHTYKPANPSGGEWRNKIQIGEETIFHSEFYQPIFNSLNVFVKPYLKHQTKNYTYSSKNLGTISINFNKSETEYGLQLGIDLNEDNRISSTFFYEQGSIKFGQSKQAQQKNNYYYSSGELSFEHDSLDQVSFPRTGSLIKLAVNYETEDLSQSESIHKQLATFSFYYSINRHTFNLYSDYANINETNSNTNQFFTLGGFQRLSGYRERELIGNKIAFARLKYQYRISGNSSNIFNFPFYIGATLERGNVFGDLIEEQPEEINLDKILNSSSLFIGMNTFLGPLYLAYGYHDKDIQSIYFYFGKSFN